MDFELDVLDRRGSHRSKRHHRRQRRRAHPHRFAWLVLGGGAVVLGLLAIAIASSLGVWGHVADAYFAASRALLPGAWHDEWMVLPGIAHVVIALAVLFVAIGLAGEILD